MKDKAETGFLESKAYRRHIKRYIQAPIHRFAAIAPPELALICKDELLALGIADTEVNEAGVEFSGKLSAVYMANLRLRTASRILCRIPPFRAGVAEELFHKVSVQSWELWLNGSVPLEVEAHVERSRIEHEGVVADTVLRGMQRRFRNQGIPYPEKWQPEPSAPEERPVRDPLLPHKQRVLVHLRENHCRLSLDTTGAHLHQRGYRLYHTGAPLRETLAAAILHKAGWKGDSPLVDGMCGAGTIAIEAALLARKLPPGLNRPFLFEMWPGFERKTWDYIRRTAAEEALTQCPAPLIAVDHSEEVLAIARQNGVRAGVSKDIKWEHRDFFTFEPRDYDLTHGMLLLNPPYGKRLSGGGTLLYERLGTHLRSSFKGWRVAVLAPDRSHAISLKLGSMRLWSIPHGGTPIIVVMGKV